METRDFCVWLDGLLGEGGHALTADEVGAVRARLSDVFVHVIDPALGDEAHVARLRAVHEGSTD